MTHGVGISEHNHCRRCWYWHRCRSGWWTNPEVEQTKDKDDNSLNHGWNDGLEEEEENSSLNRRRQTKVRSKSAARTNGA